MVENLPKHPPAYLVLACRSLSAVGFLGVLFMWLTYCRFGRLRSQVFKILLVISGLDVLLIGAAGYGPMGNVTLSSRVDLKRHERHFSQLLPYWCVAQALVSQFALVSSSLMHAYYSCHLWRLTALDSINGVRKLNSVNSNCRFALALLTSLALPLASVAVMWHLNLAGIGGDYWCHIDSSRVSPWLDLLLYIPMTACCALNLAVHLGLRCRLRRLIHVVGDGGFRLTATRLALMRNRHRFVDELSAGLATVSGVTAAVMMPAWVNWILSRYGKKDYIAFDQTLSWFILAWLFRSALHLLTLMCQVRLVRFYWNWCACDCGGWCCCSFSCCCCVDEESERERQKNADERAFKLEQGERYYMQMI